MLDWRHSRIISVECHNQNGKVVCDCAENGRPPCIINGANMPIRDKETGKMLRWVPGPREGLGQLSNCWIS
jgi:hypothetical protein